MEPSFDKLSDEKKERIINACLEVFSKTDYKHASTDDMAAKAGISKGSLFYYAKNKKDLYIFLLQFGSQAMMESAIKNNVLEIRDLFELCKTVVITKIEVLSRYPYLYDFLMKVYYEPAPEAKEELTNYMLNGEKPFVQEVRSSLDSSNFRPEITVEEAYNVVSWFSEGYMKRRFDANRMDLAEIQTEYTHYMDIFKSMFYK